MTPDLRVVPHGRPATEALAAVVAAAKRRSPLAPVTVVVPSNLVGLAARRLLGSGLVAAAAGDGDGRGGPRGIANVAFVTPFRLAELLSADLLHDRRPITNPVLGAAVRRALDETSGPFSDVAHHHATEMAFAALYGELSHVSEETLTALEGAGGSAALAVEVFRSIAAHLAAFHGEDDVARAAAGRPDLGRALAPLGHVVWYLPEPMTPALTRMVAAVRAATGATSSGATSSGATSSGAT
ncbi:MAG TPA: hypothetical protein VI854_08445, partial [Acidimicrobiia bacterium]|nr:hypothetical protein [Acidimicrobiia bacterium]